MLALGGLVVACLCVIAAGETAPSCGILSVSVTNKFAGTATAGTTFSTEDIVKHIGDLSKIALADPTSTAFNCIDGRDNAPVFSTPAGDAGEFIMGLAVYQAQMITITGTDPFKTRADVEKITHAFLDTIVEERTFYMHTDLHAWEHLLDDLNITALAEREEFDLYEVPAAKQATLLNLLVQPLNIGCGHIKNCLIKPTVYNVPALVTTWFIQSFYTYMWREDVGKAKLNLAHTQHLVVLPGNHIEKGVIIVQTDYSGLAANDICRGASPKVAPLVTPTGTPAAETTHGAGAHTNSEATTTTTTATPTSAFILHDSDTKATIRTQIASYFAKILPGSVDRKVVMDAMNTLAGTQLSATVSILAPTLPQYLVTLKVATAAQLRVAESSDSTFLTDKQGKIILAFMIFLGVVAIIVTIACLMARKSYGAVPPSAAK